jgi:hypothetical protein
MMYNFLRISFLLVVFLIISLNYFRRTRTALKCTVQNTYIVLDIIQSRAEGWPLLLKLM